MGSSFTNCHVRTSDANQCAKAASGLIRTRALLTESKKGWITLYDETSESQDIAELARIAKGLSAKLATDVLTILLHDSDVFVYQAYRSGKLTDQFKSRPDYFGEVSNTERKKWAGNFEKLLPLASAGVSVEKIRRVLGREAVLQEELVAAFARLMGIDAARAGTGFRYVQQSPHKLRLVYGRGHSALDAALIESVDQGDLERVRALLTQGISANLKSRFGESLLSSAIRFHKKEIAFALIDAGADPFLTAETNAIWAAAAHGEREILARLLESPSQDLRAGLPSALTSAVRGGHVEIVRDLLDAGADPNASGGDPLTPLMSACFRGTEVIWEMMVGREIPVRSGQPKKEWLAIVKALLDAGANVDARTSSGVTALMLARSTTLQDVVEALENAGADPALKPSGPEFEKLVQAFRAKTKDNTEPGQPAANPAPGVVPRKGHLDPKFRDIFLQLTNMDRCQVKKKKE